MRPSRLSTLLTLLLCSLLAQNSKLAVQFANASDATAYGKMDAAYNAQLISWMDSLQRRNMEAGLLKATFDCVSIRRPATGDRAITSIWSLENPYTVAIDSVVVLGGKELGEKMQEKLFKPLRSQPASRASIEKAQKLMKGYRFLRDTGTPRYAIHGEDKVALVIYLEENFQNSFMGTAGYQPQQNGETQVTGEIQVHLENTFGTASVADLWWLRKDEQSQILSLNYEEPFIWKFNVGAKLGFYQNLQDGLYVLRRTRVAAMVPYSASGKWYVGGENSSVTVTPEGDSLGLLDHSVRSVVVENEWERRNSFWNPTRGFYFRWSVEAGNYVAATAKNVVLYRSKTRFEILAPLANRLTMGLIGIGGHVGLTKGIRVPISEQFRYGGSSTLRGYREQRFRANWMVIGQVELRYHLSEVNRFYVFLDSAYDANHDSSPSAGVGIQQKTPLGVLRLDYAISPGDSPSEGKIHIRLIGQF